MRAKLFKEVRLSCLLPLPVQLVGNAEKVPDLFSAASAKPGQKWAFSPFFQGLGGPTLPFGLA